MVTTLSQIRALPPREQIAALVNHPDSLALAQAIPAEDLLLAIKKVGLDDSLELIELLSAEQVKIIFDLDVWRHEDIESASLNTWITALMAANPETALEQLRGADIEFLTIMLRKCADIYDLIENDDPVFESDLILYTSDRHYVLAFKTDAEHEVQSHFLKIFIDDLMGRDFMFAIRFIESARFETESLLHEDALRLRDGRLQDIGFLPLSEARSILTYIDIDKAKGNPYIPVAQNEVKIPKRLHYNIPSLSGLPFLREALQGLDHTTLESSWGYVVTVANRVHMAQFGNYSDSDAVNETARYTLNLMEMAISFLGEGDLAKSKQVFLAHAPQDLFKIGHSLILRLQRDFHKLCQHPSLALAATSLRRLDSPLREVTRGILQPEPQFYVGLTDPKSVDYRTFEHLREVAQVSAAISEVAFRCAVLGPNGLGFAETERGKSDTDPASFGVLLATYFAQSLVNQKGSFEALSAAEFQKFFERLAESESGHALTGEDKTICVKIVEKVAFSLTGLVGMRTQEDAEQRASTYAKIVIGLIETELGAINDERPNPQFITSMLIK